MAPQMASPKPVPWICTRWFRLRYNFSKTVALARRTNHSQRARGNGNLGGRFAHKFSVSVNLERSLGLHLDSLGPRVLHFGQEEMAPEVHRRKHAEQFKRAQLVDPADVELAIGEIRFRRDAHAVAIELRVGEGGEQGELFSFGMILAIDLRQPHGKSREFQ